MEKGMIKTCPDCGGDWPDSMGLCPLCERVLVKVPIEELRPKAGLNTEPPGQSGGHKTDQGKLRYDLIPTWPLEQLAAVMTYGANTYGNHDWQRGLKYSRLYAAAQRHMNAFWKGEGIDKDSSLPHLAHAAANCLMLLEYQYRGYDDLGFDDSVHEAYTAEDIRAMIQEGSL